MSTSKTPHTAAEAAAPGQSFGPYLLLLIPPLLWAGNVVLARGVNQLIPPVAMSFLRWATALLFIAPLTRRQVRRDWTELRRSWRILSLISLLGISSFNTLLYTAVQTTTAINCALMQTAMPAVIILLTFLFFRERISPLQGLGVALCMAGSGILVLHGELAALLRMDIVSGDLWMLLAVVCYALYSVLLRYRPRVHPLSFLTATFALGTFFLVPLYLWERLQTGPLAVSGTVVLSILYVALGPSVVAYLCWNRGIELVGANRAGLYINLIPLFASLMAVIWLGEAFRAYHAFGLALICGGLALFNRSLWKPGLRRLLGRS